MNVPTQRNTDPSHDVLRYERDRLRPIFQPRAVAVVGATERPGSVGRTIIQNLVGSPFGGTIFPINPKRTNVLGIKAYPTLADLPEPIDLAVIVTPATSVPGIIDECVAQHIPGAIIISAGFAEIGPEGVELERQTLQAARRGRMRLLGPNCLGLMSPYTGLNATFAANMARPGPVGFISQSGALCTAILDWSRQADVGFSAFVSIGSMLDISWGDLIYHLGDDPRTKSIVIYMESIGDARVFLSAAREVSLSKPIIVLKAGRTEAGARAAASHTGALTGSDEVLDAAFRRCGVLRVKSIADLFAMSDVLAKQPRPRGPRLTIITNAGGPGVLAADSLLAERGELTCLSDDAKSRLNALLPAAWSHQNPVDVLGDAGPDRYAGALEITAKDPESDGVLVILTPQAMTDPTQTAQQLSLAAKGANKPVLASWMGGSSVAAGEHILIDADIPTFKYPDTAARIFAYMWRYTYNLRGLYETPETLSDPADQNGRNLAAREIVETVRQQNRTLLDERESKQLLQAYDIPTVPTRDAATAEQAVETAEEFGYPIVLKLLSRTITHKTDVGGVKLNLPDAQAVRRAFADIRDAVTQRAGAEHFQGVTVQPMIRLDNAYELIVGSSIDPQFGPVLLFGAGGQLVEIIKDRALALPPLNTTLALRMMEQTHIFRALRGVRGRDPVDLPALQRLLVRFSQLVAEQPRIAEIDINPLLVSSDRIVALDARVVLHKPELDAAALPRLAVRPYPARYVRPWKSKKDTALLIRPIRPEDEPLLVQFHQMLSEQSVYFRYFQTLNLSQRTAHERLSRICFIDYDREMALVAARSDPQQGPQIVAVGRLSKVPGTAQAEFAIVVADPFQNEGLGTELLERLIEVARNENLRSVRADILSDNLSMQRVCEKLGFKLTTNVEDRTVEAELRLA